MGGRRILAQVGLMGKAGGTGEINTEAQRAQSSNRRRIKKDKQSKKKNGIKRGGG
jgi:hypothetical protein